ncbi:MAG TPA: hypothetical protein VFW78_03550 [Bacteroidia bacterium]|nr:hypothetical protein [Bacteroidia bacterium]
MNDDLIPIELPSGFIQKALEGCSSEKVAEIYRYRIYKLEPVADRWGHFIKCKYFFVISSDCTEKAVFSVVRFNGKYHIQKKFRTQKMDSEMLSYIVQAFCSTAFKIKFPVG